MIFQGASVASVVFEPEDGLVPGSSVCVLVRRIDLKDLLDHIDDLEFEVSKLKGTARLTHPAAVLHEALNRRAE
jgi:hypothetical protein